MENKKINLTEILNYTRAICSFVPIPDSFITVAMKEACRQVLELAAENACLLDNGRKLNSNRYTIEIHDVYYVETEIEVSKQSILDTINQVIEYK